MLTTTVNKVILNGNGSTTIFPYTFPIPDTASLVVIYTDADGAETTLGASLFSVTGIGTTTGGNVTYPLSGSAIASGTKLTIRRVVPYTQETNLENQGGYYPDVVEAALDLLTMEIQQLKEVTDRAIVTPVTDTAPSAIPQDATDRANTALLFDGSGNPYAGAIVSGLSGVSAFILANVLPAASAAATRTAIGVGSAGTLAITALQVPPQGRLTLATGVPVMVSAQTGKTTIYYTPYAGNIVPIYDGTQFTPTVFAELSNVTTNSAAVNPTLRGGPAAVANNSNYDLFVWDDSGTLRLTRGPLWTSDTGRGTGAGTTQLTMVAGILTNTVAITNGPAASRGTYVGTVRSDGSAQCNWQPGAIDTPALLNVWNCYNRRPFFGFIGDSTNTWNYNTGTVRAAGGVNTVRASYIQGLQEDFFEGEYTVSASNTAANPAAAAGIGLDSTSALSGRYSLAQLTTIALPMSGSHRAQSLGFHFMQACEYGGGGGGTTTWYGDNGSPTVVQSGMEVKGWF